MYICDFSRSVGAGSATTRNTRGLTRSVIRLMVPPLPAVSRPSNTMQIFAPLAFTHSCSATSSPCRRRISRSYSFRFILGLGSAEDDCPFGGAEAVSSSACDDALSSFLCVAMSVASRLSDHPCGRRHARRPSYIRRCPAPLPRRSNEQPDTSHARSPIEHTIEPTREGRRTNTAEAQVREGGDGRRTGFLANGNGTLRAFAAQAIGHDYTLLANELFVIYNKHSSLRGRRGYDRQGAN